MRMLKYLWKVIQDKGSTSNHHTDWAMSLLTTKKSLVNANAASNKVLGR
jgi:hypothetical protein